MSKRNRRGGGLPPPPKRTCRHYGQEPIRVGLYFIRAGGTQYFQPGDFEGYDLIVPLTSSGYMPFKAGHRYQVFGLTLVDYGGVPENWKELLEEVIKELKAGKEILTFCVGSHGRTGTFLASLIALLESAEETPDPIEAVRQRHCHHAVETRAQAEAIFALRGEPLPEKYQSAFKPPASIASGQGPQPAVP